MKQAWKAPGLGGEPLYIVRSPFEPDPSLEVLPKAFALRYLDEWVRDPILRQRLVDLHATLVGGLGLTSWGAEDATRVVRTALAEAFERGALVVLVARATGVPAPVRPAVPVGPPPSGRPPPLAVKTFVEIELIDDAGMPVAGAQYRVTLPDGTVRTGALDDRGLVRFDGIEPGECDIEFPQIDGREWE